jgi:hypothetical protein
MRTPWICLVAFAGLFLEMSITGTDVESAATATNQLGVDLHRRLATGEGNLCLSPTHFKARWR